MPVGPFGFILDCIKIYLLYIHANFSARNFGMLGNVVNMYVYTEHVNDHLLVALCVNNLAV